jgi:hypothetical protein
MVEDGALLCCEVLFVLLGLVCFERYRLHRFCFALLESDNVVFLRVLIHLLWL